MSPYVQIWTIGEKFKTKVHHHGTALCADLPAPCFRPDVRQTGHTTPTWEQSFIFNLEGKEDVVHMFVYCQETLSDKLIGKQQCTAQRAEYE